MNTSTQLAKHLREVFFGGNWTVSHVKDQLSDVTWQQAVTQIHSFNTIATLAFHISYFVKVVTKVLEGGPLEGNDKLSFAHPPIKSRADWEQFVQKILADAETCAALVEQLSESTLYEGFAGTDKYGTYYRNLLGIIEHTHYHLGQIALIKKIV